MDHCHSINTVIKLTVDICCFLAIQPPFTLLITSLWFPSGLWPFSIRVTWVAVTKKQGHIIKTKPTISSQYWHLREWHRVGSLFGVSSFLKVLLMRWPNSSCCLVPRVALLPNSCQDWVPDRSALLSPHQGDGKKSARVLYIPSFGIALSAQHHRLCFLGRRRWFSAVH